MEASFPSQTLRNLKRGILFILLEMANIYNLILDKKKKMIPKDRIL